MRGLQIFWILVMFDLPTVSADERKAANDFRHLLYDMGFERWQLSAYMRFCASGRHFTFLCNTIQTQMPAGGRVDILQFTDEQYARIMCYENNQPIESIEPPESYSLFD